MSCRRYIPILKDYPNRYIYEPWNAPESLQKAVNCVVGVDYPKPMINHAESSRLNIERMKQVYQQLSHYRGLSKSFFGDEEWAATFTSPLIFIGFDYDQSAIFFQPLLDH